MAVLNIALLGACPVQLSELAATLEIAIHALDAKIRITTADAASFPASFAGIDLVLLAGLESCAPAHGKDKPQAAHGSETADGLIRAALALAGVSYRVLYGTAGERTAHALHAVQSLLPAATLPKSTIRQGGPKKQPWVWMCDKCSDPQCEHRLLTALLAGRDSALAVQPTPAQPVRPY